MLKPAARVDCLAILEKILSGLARNFLPHSPRSGTFAQNTVADSRANFRMAPLSFVWQLVSAGALLSFSVIPMKWEMLPRQFSKVSA